MPVTRRYCFTRHKYTDEILSQYKMTIGPNYICFGLEVCPKTKTPHMQGYVEFPEKRSMKYIKELFADKMMYLTSCNGTPEQNRDYCKKEGIFYELGEMIPDTPGKRNDIDAVYDDIKKGHDLKELSNSHFVPFVKFHRGFSRYYELNAPRRMEPTKILIRWGSAGIGKSRHFWETVPGLAPVDYINGFFNGFDSQEAVLFDDLEESTIPLKLMLRICDRYPMTVNVKGSVLQWTVKTLCITANHDPTKWYNDGTGAWTRRLKEFATIFHVVEDLGGGTLLPPDLAPK